MDIQLSPQCPWKDTVQWFSTIDSTNTRAKLLARDGAPEGTVLIAGAQTGGRGRLGRSFSSPQGMGVYLSCILRPDCRPEALMHLTCAAGAAMCLAVQDVSGLCPSLKWTNDLVVGKRKLGGILTEISVSPSTGLVEYAVVGIGINCCQHTEDFPAELQDMAVSLSAASGKEITPQQLAAAMISRLYEMKCKLFAEKSKIMDFYRRHCITLGKSIQVIRGDNIRTGKALDLSEDGSLLVRYSDGEEENVASGEVTIRGMYGYL